MFTALALLCLRQSPSNPASDSAELAETKPDEILEAQQIERARRTLGAFAISGELVFGWRAVEVDGSDAQFAEDFGLDTGPVLRDFLVEGVRASGAGAIESWLLSANGVGDPHSSASAELEASAVAVSGRYDRSTFEANAQDGLHGFDFERESASVRIERAHASTSDVHGGLELTWLAHDGFGPGTRSVDFGFVSNVATRKEERSLGLGGDLGFRAGGWSVALDASGRTIDARDLRDFSEPSPSDPGSTQTEDFDADTDGHALAFGARATRRFGRTDVDFGMSLARTELASDLHSFETGIQFDPSLPFERDTTGDADLDGRSLAIDAGFRREVSAALAWLGRISHERESDDGDLFREIVLDEFSGPPSVSQFFDRGLHESTLDLAEAGAELALSSTADLTLLVSAGREDIHILETVNGNSTLAFDGTRGCYGGEATLDWEPARAWQWTFSAGHEVAPQHNAVEGTGFDVFDDRGTFGSVRARWKAARALTLTGSLRHQHSESEAFGSVGDSTWLTLGAIVASRSGWTADCALALRQFDLQADTFIVVLNPAPTQVPATARFEGTQASVSGSLAREVSEKFQPRLSWSASLGSGDGDFRYMFLLTDLPYRVAAATSVGVEIQLASFDGQDSPGPSDFDSVVGLIYVRTGF